MILPVEKTEGTKKGRERNSLCTYVKQGSKVSHWKAVCHVISKELTFSHLTKIYIVTVQTC